MLSTRSLPEALHLMMRRAGALQADVAEELDVSQATVSRWVLGRIDLRFRQLAHLADVLGYRIELRFVRELPPAVARGSRPESAVPTLRIYVER